MPKKYNYTKKTGRPTKYKPEYCQEIIKFFSGKPNYRVKQEYGYKLFPNDVPFFLNFALKIRIDDDTLNEWCKVHSEFSDSYKLCKQLQKQFLITNGLLGLYPTGSYCFTAKNITDMRDHKDIGITGKLGVDVTMKNLLTDIDEADDRTET